MDRSERFEKDTGFERSRGGRFFMQFKGKGRRSVNGWLICYWFFLISGRVIFLSMIVPTKPITRKLERLMADGTIFNDRHKKIIVVLHILIGLIIELFYEVLFYIMAKPLGKTKPQSLI